MIAKTKLAGLNLVLALTALVLGFGLGLVVGILK